MVEAQAATMLISMVGKSATYTVSLAAKSTETLAKIAAFLLSLWKTSSVRGKVRIAKLLESGAQLSAVAMNKENYQRLQAMAKSEGIAYHAVHRQDIDGYLVTLKSEDLQRVKTIFEFYDMREADLKQPIEDVHKDEDAMYKMDEQDVREAANLEQEVQNNARMQQEDFDFEARKQEVIRQNGGADFEVWARGADKGNMPKNTTLYLKADQAVLDGLQRLRKNEKLREAKAVKELKQKKLVSMETKLPQIKSKKIGMQR